MVHGETDFELLIGLLSQLMNELIEFQFGTLLFELIALLEDADQVVALSGDSVEVVVSELAPFRFELGPELLPIAADLVPVHLCIYLSKERIAKNPPALGN